MMENTHAENWNGAQWIWEKADGQPNSWMAFRKAVELPSVPEKAIAKIAVDSRYWLWINGELVVFEGGFARGPQPAQPWKRVPEIWTKDASLKPTDTWYDEVDLAPFLKKGSNTIAALAWYWGRETHKGAHIDSGKGGLLFHAELGGQTVVSNSSWKAKLHPAYALDSGDNGEMVVAYPVKYDARNDMGDWGKAAWTGAEFPDESWLDAVEKGTPPSAPWYSLEKNLVPRLTDHGLQNFENFPASKFPFTSDGQTISASLPFNKQITPYLEIESEAGKTITITTDNRLNKITADYTTKAGVQAFECFSWMNGHSVKYEIPAGVKVLGLKYRWMSVGEMAGSFECSDPFFQRLWWMGRNTISVCSRGNFMDCPDRERALWIGDVADQASYLFYVMDESGRQLLRNSIRTTMAFSDEKVFGALGPLRIRELPAQSLQFIPDAIWQYYFNTGDKDTLAYAYPFVKDYLSLWELKFDGMPKYRVRASEDSWDWVDWGEKNTEDKEVIQAALYFRAMKSAREMAVELGKKEDLDFYDERISGMEKSFDKRFWTGKFYSSKPGTLADDRANCLTILSGIAAPEKHESIVKNVLIPNQYCSPHFEWMVELAMCEAGFHKEALERMKARYGKQVGMKKLTTLYETFPIGGSYNHAWNAPNTVLSKEIAGIAPTKPGWSEYHILPNLVDFTSLKQVVPSVKGDIIMDILAEEGTYKMSLVSPKDTIATVGIPKIAGDFSTITANRKVVWENGSFKASDEGVSKESESDDFIRFRVDPGSWKFEARE